MIRQSVILLLIFPILISCVLIPYENFTKCSVTDEKGDTTGEPLFLTRFLRNGTVTPMQLWQASEVSGRRFCHYFDSYSGYLTVNELHNSNLFFWFVLSEVPSEVDRENAPIILWLQGGPGMSSLTGLFQENGPLVLTESGIDHRKYSWNEKFHLLYIDSPVGSGFSFTDKPEAYATSVEDVARDLFNAIEQFTRLFAETRDMKWYFAGESYAGKYIPALAKDILKAKEFYERTGLGTPPIHLEGLIIGSGLTDPINQLKYADHLYNLGMIDNSGRKTIQKFEKRIAQLIQNKDTQTAFNALDAMIFNIQQLIGDVDFNNILKNKNQTDHQILADFVQRPDVRRMLHVGNRTFYDGNIVMRFMEADIVNSMASYMAELLDHYRILIYNGQLDAMVPYTSTVNYLEKLKFSAANIYKNATRSIWKVDNEVAGYVKVAGNLTEVLVRKAGHMAPKDQPKWLYDLVDRFISGRSFS